MQIRILVLIIAVAVVGVFMFVRSSQFDLPDGETVLISESDIKNMTNTDKTKGREGVGTKTSAQTTQTLAMSSTREIFVTDGVKHSIPLDEIRQGCFGRDCIASVDEPVFISTNKADGLLPDDTVGIALTYKEEGRFYPFNMLVTREIVNDVVSGDPLAITYCPLCSTGVVFGRRVGNKTFEFGVSGMLWQSNLLMYNREDKEEDISLWSQVLGEAVLGAQTGIKLSIVPSDILRYTDWRKNNPDGKILDTGRIGDPYNGNYYSVARGFSPNFDESTSTILPTAHVFGIELNGQFKAYERDALKDGITKDAFAGQNITIEKSDIGEVRFFVGSEKEPLPTIAGFWFSWISAHPLTELFQQF